MRLDRLELLHRSMREQQIERYNFQFSRNRANFDVFFFIDTRPYELLFGCIGTRFAFVVKVSEDFWINSYLDAETYTNLCDALGLRSNPHNRFSTTAFFQDFNRAIPTVAYAKHIPPPHKIAVYRRDVEEADKIYFLGWRRNTEQGKRVTPGNLKKTRILLGEQVYERCKRQNVSSCWTDNSRTAPLRQ